MLRGEPFGLPDFPTDGGIDVEEYPKEGFCDYQLSWALYKTGLSGLE